MSFDDLARALIKRFASRALNWHLRQTLAERVQLEDWSISDYVCSLQKLFTRVNLARTEWFSKFVFGLKNKEICDHLILQDVDKLERAVEIVMLKEASLGKIIS